MKNGNQEQIEAAKMERALRTAAYAVGYDPKDFHSARMELVVEHGVECFKPIVNAPAMSLEVQKTFLAVWDAELKREFSEHQESGGPSWRDDAGESDGEEWKSQS